MIREAKPGDMEACIEIEHSLFGEDKDMLRDYPVALKRSGV